MRPECRPKRPEHEIAQIAAAQLGAVSHAQLVALGLGERAVGRALEAGRLHAVHHGVYCVGHPWLSRQGSEIAALLAVGDEAALSHRTAAARLELRRAQVGPIDVSSLVRGRRPQAGIVVHRPRTLRAADIVVVEGLRCTDASRTIADLAAVIGARDVARVLRQAERLGELDAAGIRRHLGPGRRGSRTLGRLLAGYEEGLTLRSELEELFLELVLAAGLPTPVVNALVDGYEVDFLWPRQRLIVETDGYATHAGRDAFEEDRRRDAALLTSGHRVLRLTWRQVTRERAATIRTLRSLLV